MFYNIPDDSKKLCHMSQHCKSSQTESACITSQFVKGKGFLEVGTRSLAALTTFRFNTRLIVMMWQPEWNLNNSFVLSRTDFRFGMEVLWDNRHQPYTSLLCQFSCHGNQLKISITPLFWVALRSYLVWRFFETVCISYMPRCYGNSVAMATRMKP